MGYQVGGIKMDDPCIGEILKIMKLNKPITIEPEESLSNALRIMEDNKFSQLPVLQKSTHRCLGLLSFKSIVKQIQLKENLRKRESKKADLLSLPVKHFTDPNPVYVSSRDIVYELFKIVKDEDAVLVGRRCKKPSFLVTSYDLVEIAEKMFEAFLLIQHIETSIRSIIQHQLEKHNQNFSETAQKVNQPLAASGCKTLLPTDTVEKMTIDNYKVFIENNDNFRSLFFEVFNDINIVRDRLEFVRDLRNDVFHFRKPAYSLEEAQIRNLKKIEKWLRNLV